MIQDRPYLTVSNWTGNPIPQNSTHSAYSANSVAVLHNSENRVAVLDFCVAVLEIPMSYRAKK